MYTPKHFAPQSFEQVEALLHKNAFGILVSLHQKKLVATHIPLVYHRKDNDTTVLYGHVSKANPQGQTLSENEEVLAIFSGAHTFVTADWYAQENVSTWNYIAAHAYGKVHILEGDAQYDAIKILVDKYESPTSKARMENLSPDTITHQLRGITAFEIQLSRIEANFKLSQNRDNTDFQEIIFQLERQNDPNSHEIAAEMKKIRP